MGHVGVDLEVGEGGGGEPAFLALVSRLESANSQVNWTDLIPICAKFGYFTKLFNPVQLDRRYHPLAAQLLVWLT